LPRNNFILPVAAPPASAPNQTLPQNIFLFYLFLRHQGAHQPNIAAEPVFILPVSAPPSAFADVFSPPPPCLHV
jgi:hypothetical protein